MSQTQWVIVGAGAIGSILAAHLVRSGRAVTVLARGRRAQQIQADGLRIKGLSEITAPVRVVTDASQLSCAGTLIIATKTPGSEDLLQQLRHVKVDAALLRTPDVIAWRSNGPVRRLYQQRVKSEFLQGAQEQSMIRWIQALRVGVEQARSNVSRRD